MSNERLNAFLVDDIQAIATPDYQFENLGDFASYWSNRIGKLSE